MQMRREQVLPALLGFIALLLPTAAFAAIAVPHGNGPAMLTEPTRYAAWLTVAPIVLPIIGSALTLAFRHKIAWQANIAFGAMFLATVSAVFLNIVVLSHGPLLLAAGNWLPPFGIIIAVDVLGALLVLVTCLVGFIGLSYARCDVDHEGASFGFYTFYCLLIAGVCGSFATGDIFNLYVWFEVFLVSSFGMIVFGGERIQMDGAVKYGVLNLIATTIFLIAVGALYGFTGTLNMADIRHVLAETEGAPVVTVGALFVLAFAMKAAAFPLHFWLPASYHTPRIVVGALFAGLLTKVGIYSLMRVMIMLFGDKGTMFLPLIGWVGVATAVLAALGALAQTNLRRLAAFLVISGVGVMMIGIGLDTAEGLTGAIVYAVHSILVMTALFLVIGVVERLTGDADLTIGSNVYARYGLAAGLFLIFGLAVSGLPPFSGFWPKLMLVQASLAGSGALALAGAVGVILSGLLTTIAIGRAWVLVFLRPRDGSENGHVAVGAPRAMAAPLVALAILVVALGLLPTIVIAPAQSGAAGLLDPTVYLQRVQDME
ncbi:proton-conducting transporter transmembrane domain-containing protein [Acuticoccus mangrovi]|uniref:Na+/H+ antiporter subunit D n=1 Tax=Acuticoccus mangrovi TaxID=2796142 RepID=A0A934ILC6_9HYPH|nr:proton-conducting transporter membrane subunit [Acuticoccus mangrovi]MBJ3774486.1 Na+/H+ antiporter subunit D [Acuticoccus mangrovi]